MNIVYETKLLVQFTSMSNWGLGRSILPATHDNLIG
jgi:hypothetical protein